MKSLFLINPCLNLWISLIYQDKKKRLTIFLESHIFGMQYSVKSLYFLQSWICLFTFSIVVWPFMLYLLKAEMKRFATVDTSVLKQHYEKKVLDLEHEKKSLLVSAVSVKLRLWLNGLVSKPFSTCCLLAERDRGTEAQSCKYFIYFWWWCSKVERKLPSKVKYAGGTGEY